MKGFLPAAQLFLKRNSSTILTCIGAAGVVATTVLAVKATPKAMVLLDKAKEEKGEELTKLETVKIVGPAYIPSIAVGASTIACIFGANVLNKRQQASLISAYGLLDNSYKQYKKKVQDIFGEESQKLIIKDLAEDYSEQNNTQIEDDEEMFLDFYSLQFFKSTEEKVKAAEKLINDKLFSGGYVFLYEYYDALGITTADCEYHLGWFDRCGPIEFEHETIVTENGEKYCVISMNNEPFPIY